MRSISRTLLLPILCAFLPYSLLATHNRAGEIHIQQIGPLTVRATIITWTRTSSVNADRDTLTINWGDGTSESVPRDNGNGIPYPNDIKYNIYVKDHTFAGPATYRISMTDPNRIAGIINVNPPSSDNVPFHIETIYSFQDPQFGGNNTTPYLLQPPIDNACVGKLFIHNPNAFDPEGDSLSYQLIVPLQGLSTPVPNYSYPDEIIPGGNNTLQLDERTGIISWFSPQAAGEYNLAFIVVSWRGGVPIDTTIRDMQIFVDRCNNNPPNVQTVDELCVIAGTTVEFPVFATDPDSNDYVQLTALGGPLDANLISRATFTGPTGFQRPPLTGTFRWQTTCEHISNQPYSVVFKAVDSQDSVTAELADLKTVSIKVVGPPPEDVQATTDQGSVEVTWGKPYVCENAADNYFYGFSVWRREGSKSFPLDTCAPGLAGKGYTQLIFVTKQTQNGRYYFKDTNVERGRTYCYRILGKFARISAGGYPYNVVESLPSEEVCVQLPRDLPLLTNVSVVETDATAGQIKVVWTKPSSRELDTIVNHGPYRYQLLRAPGFSGGTFQEVAGASFTAPTFWQANDTMFLDQNLNTQGQPYRYEIAFYVRGENTPLGTTTAASSVFLTVNSTDETNLLSWQEEVPWENYSYAIYRRNATGQFDSIASTINMNYADRGLVNGQEYCYYIRSEGTYGVVGLPSPLLNDSQRACGSPLDTIPPCAPELLPINNLCNSQGGPAPDPPYENNLRWTNPNQTCNGSQDVVQYKIWYAPSTTAQLVVIATQQEAGNTSYIHALDDGLTGCYAVSAVDSADNESALSNTICVDNCPEYILPNAFTPNGDSRNDVFTPFPGWRFVERVEMQIFNRWGNLVFVTTDPAINWTGTNTAGKELTEGAYLYVCKIFERRVEGLSLRPDPLSGYIELVRSGN